MCNRPILALQFLFSHLTYHNNLIEFLQYPVGYRFLEYSSGAWIWYKVHKSVRYEELVHVMCISHFGIKFIIFLISWGFPSDDLLQDLIIYCGIASCLFICVVTTLRLAWHRHSQIHLLDIFRPRWSHKSPVDSQTQSVLYRLMPCFSGQNIKQSTSTGRSLWGCIPPTPQCGEYFLDIQNIMTPMVDFKMTSMERVHLPPDFCGGGKYLFAISWKHVDGKMFHLQCTSKSISVPCRNITVLAYNEKLTNIHIITFAYQDNICYIKFLAW